MTISEATHEVDSTGTTVDPDLIEMMDAVFAAYRREREPAPTVGDNTELWLKLSELGLLRLTGSTLHGGSGAGWAEAAELISAAVRHGVRAPLAEHDLLACWLLEAAGLPTDDTPCVACRRWAVRPPRAASRPADRVRRAGRAHCDGRPPR